MRKSTKIMVTLGVVAGLGIAALPLGASSALTPTIATDDDNATVNLTANVGVAYAISADAASKSVSVTPGGNVATVEGSVTAAANGPYTVSAKSTTNGGALKSGTGDSAPTIAAADGASVALGSSNPGWGIQYGNLIGTGNYAGLGEARTVTSKDSASATNGDVINITYGVAAASGQTSGQYTGTITYTIAHP